MPITNSREIRSLRDSLQLSDRQRKILTGSLLGDGCLIPNWWKRHYRFQAEQNESHKAYIFWFYDEFKDWVLSEPKYHPKVRSWKFRTISHPDFTALASQFYQGGTKILPPNIRHLLQDGLTLAVWAMDDGCLMTRGDGFTFNTQSFTYKENQELQRCLNENFGLVHTSLHKDKNRARLYIRSKSLARLRELIEPYVLLEFTYKLPKPRRDLIPSGVR